MQNKQEQFGERVEIPEGKGVFKKFFENKAIKILAFFWHY